MGQLYYAQTQLYSIVLGGEIQRTVRIKHRGPLLTSRSSSFKVLLANSLPGPKPADLHASGWRGSYGFTAPRETRQASS